LIPFGREIVRREEFQGNTKRQATALLIFAEVIRNTTESIIIDITEETATIEIAERGISDTGNDTN